LLGAESRSFTNFYRAALWELTYLFFTIFGDKDGKPRGDTTTGDEYPVVHEGEKIMCSMSKINWVVWH
jgi:hypothetical protein